MFKKLLLLATTPVVLASCGGSGSNSRINIWLSSNQFCQDAYAKLIDEYNNGQGKQDGIFVKASYKGRGYSSNITTQLKSSDGVIDVVGLQDRYFNDNAMQDLLENLSSYYNNDALTLKDENGNRLFNIDEYADTQLDRFRMDVSTKEAGHGKDLYAFPAQVDPTVLLYNKTVLEAANINIISVPESQLGSTTFKNVGYGEYATAPAENMVASKNHDGRTVYKVFNNRIPMSWAQVRTLAKYLTKSYNSSSPTTYGFFTEWWFGYGWGVGGDCLNYDVEEQAYKFTLGDSKTNYLVTKDTTINGESYKAGSLVNYETKKYLHNNPGAVDDSVYPFPTQYDAFSEFVGLSQEKTHQVNPGKYGYAISPSPATLNNQSRNTYFTAQNCAMVYTYFSDCNNISKAAGGKFVYDAAPVLQYREYNGGEEDANGNIKVIENGVYDAEIKTVNSTRIVGKTTMVSEQIGWGIPKNSKNKEAAFKFLQWFCSDAAQTIMIEANDLVPAKAKLNQDKFVNYSTKLFDNYDVVSELTNTEELGDWSYLENNQWVSNWADVLNTDVRNGTMTLDQFFNAVGDSTNNMLKDYKIRIIGK